MRKALCMTLLAMLLGLSGCAAVPIAVGVGATTAGGIAYWLLNQPWSAKICYWVGDEAALKIMPAASANVDADTIAVCGECVAYLEKAQGLSADQINAELAARLASLPPAQVVEIQTAATILDEFLPAATSTAPLSAGEINDIQSFFKGYADGTKTCLDNKPASIAKALAKASRETLNLRAKHPAAAKAVQPSGWLMQVAPVSSKDEDPGGCCAPKPWPTQEKN